MAIQTAEHNMSRLSLVWPLTYSSFSSNRGRFKSGPFYQLKIKVKLGVANFLVQQRVFFKFSSSSSPPSLSHSKSMAFLSGPCFCRCRWGWGHSKGLAVSGGWGGVWQGPLFVPRSFGGLKVYFIHRLILLAKELWQKCLRNVENEKERDQTRKRRKIFTLGW